jgi:4-carboxymuconolactone decarboxylase
MAALLYNQKLADLTGQMATQIFDELSVSRIATELAILLTARHWNRNYSFDTHHRCAIKFGMKEKVVDAIEIGAHPKLDDELEPVYEFATQLLRDGDVSDEVFGRVADRWGRQGAVELIATVGFSSMIALVLNVDRYPVPLEEEGRVLPRSFRCRF